MTTFSVMWTLARALGQLVAPTIDAAIWLAWGYAIFTRRTVVLAGEWPYISVQAPR